MYSRDKNTVMGTVGGPQTDLVSTACASMELSLAVLGTDVRKSVVTEYSKRESAAPHVQVS